VLGGYLSPVIDAYNKPKRELTSEAAIFMCVELTSPSAGGF